MNRYQFEDSISDYIENKLSLSKRKEFDSYLKENPEAKKIVLSITSNIELLKALPQSKVDKKFNTRLLKDIDILKKKRKKKTYDKGTILGFTPAHATILSGLFISLIYIFMQLFPYNQLMKKVDYTYQSSEKKIEPDKKDVNMVNNINQNMINVSQDSIKNDSISPVKKDFSKKIHFVND